MIYQIFNTYKDLRKYVLERDMYKEAGMTFAHAIENLSEYDENPFLLYKTEVDAALTAYKEAIK